MRFLSVILLMQVCFCNACVPSSKMKSNAPDAEQLIQSIKEGKAIFMEDKTINGDFDLASAAETVTENDAVQRGFISSSITFRGCTFKGKVIAFKRAENDKIVALLFTKNVTFINCIFEEAVSFRSAIFNAPGSFQECNFYNEANFEECTFINETYFNKTKYVEEVRFQNCVFMKKTSWMDSRFDSNVSFQGAVFYNDAQFSVVQFLKYADFTLVNFGANTFFNYAVFQGQAIFNNSMFRSRCEFLNTKFDRAEIKTCYFLMPPKFYKNETKSFIDFSKSTFVTGVPDLSTMQSEQPIVVKGELIREGVVVLSESDFIGKSGFRK